MLERTWAATLERVAAMPAGMVDISVDGEWSFAQTLRHLVMATNTWLRRAILEIEQPYHPVGQPNVEYGTDEEWEHHRYAVRDLEAIGARSEL